MIARFIQAVDAAGWWIGRIATWTVVLMCAVFFVAVAALLWQVWKGRHD